LDSISTNYILRW